MWSQRGWVQLGHKWAICQLVPHISSFQPCISMATTANFGLDIVIVLTWLLWLFNVLKNYGLATKGRGRHNGLIQGFFLGQIFKIKSWSIRCQLWGIPSSALWNHYYKLQCDTILCEFEFCKLEIPSYKISISLTLCTIFNTM